MNSDISFKRYKRYYTYITPLLRGKRVKSYTYLILTFFTAAFFAFSAIRPTVKTVINLRRQIIDGRHSDSRLQEKIKSLSLGQEMISNIAGDFPTIEGVIPKKPNVSFLLKQVENLTATNPLSIHSLSFETVPLRKDGLNPAFKPKTTLRSITFVFTLKGSYENLVLFLENAQGLRRILILEDLRITKEGARIEEGVLSLTAKARAFYRD